MPDLPVSARLLLVEDDPDLRRALRLALHDEGYDVVEAATAATRCCSCPASTRCYWT